MLNMIQMDIFRMFKTKSLYVIAIIIVAAILIWGLFYFRS